MADTNDPDLVAFANDFARLFADRFGGQKASIDRATSLWFGTISPLAATLGVSGTDLILDGSENDGRITMTWANLTSLITLALAVQTDADAAGVMDNVNKISVNPSQHDFF